MNATEWRARTMTDLIVEVWEALDCESVGRHELERIAKELLEKFGAGVSQSPAAIARTLAEEGAVLRHPEVFEWDSEWRKQRLAQTKLGTELSFSSLPEALASFEKLETKRHELDNNGKELERLRLIVISARQQCHLTAQSTVLSSEQREEAKEISEWLAVWLRSPQLFPDWLDLRMRAAEFKKKFP
jgi:hypothetical protein